MHQSCRLRQYRPRRRVFQAKAAGGRLCRMIAGERHAPPVRRPSPARRDARAAARRSMGGIAGARWQDRRAAAPDAALHRRGRRPPAEDIAAALGASTPRASRWRSTGSAASIATAASTALWAGVTPHDEVARAPPQGRPRAGPRRPRAGRPRLSAAHHARALQPHRRPRQRADRPDRLRGLSDDRVLPLRECARPRRSGVYGDRTLSAGVTRGAIHPRALAVSAAWRSPARLPWRAS